MGKESQCDVICGSSCTRPGCTAKEPNAHVWDNTCDTDCNVCGSTRTPSYHADVNMDNKCDICGADVEHEYVTPGTPEVPSVPDVPSSNVELAAAGCGGMISGISMGVTLLGGAAFLLLKKKKEE